MIHLTAIARRAGIDLSLDDFHNASAQAPLLVDVKPAGSGYMEDFHNAGGMPALLKALEPLLDLDAMTVTGRTLGEVLAGQPDPGDWQKPIRTLDEPLGPAGALRTLKGSLAPDGAVIKAAAATESLMQHSGPAVVFDSPADAAARIDDPDLDVSADSVLVLRHAGPIAAGMPEAGYLPIPAKLARQGVKDMVRVSDGRMSGTAFGTVVLHCTPEAAACGPLALVRDGDIISLDVNARTIDLVVSASELEKRRKDYRPPELPARGWERLHAECVLPAHLGADLDFL